MTDGNVGETKSTKVTVNEEAEAYSPFIYQVFAYRPAPGSKITSNPTDTEEIARKKAEDILKGADINNNNAMNLVQLGSLGGYVTFGFDHTIVNVPGKRDFRVNSMISSSIFQV